MIVNDTSIDLHRYLSSSAFTTSKGRNHSLGDIRSTVNVYDYILSVIAQDSKCCNLDIDKDSGEILIPKSMFSTTKRDKQTTIDNIDISLAIACVLENECGCSTGVASFKLMGLKKRLKGLYFSYKTTVYQQTLSYSKRGQNIELSGAPDKRNAAIITNDAVNLDKLIQLVTEAYNCCLLAPIAAISFDTQNLDRLNIVGSSVDPSCSGVFSATLEILDASDNVLHTENYTHATLPSVYMLSSVPASILEPGTFKGRITITDCVGTATATTQFEILPVSIDIVECTSSSNTIKIDLCAITIDNLSPICSGVYTVKVDVKDSSGTLLNSQTYDQTTFTGQHDVSGIATSCGSYTIEAILTDCIDSATDTLIFTIYDEPVAVQSTPVYDTALGYDFDGTSSTACDTDDLADEYNWIIQDDKNLNVDNTGFNPTSTVLAQTYFSGVASTPKLDAVQLYRDTCSAPGVSITVTPVSGFFASWNINVSSTGFCTGYTYQAPTIDFTVYDRDGTTVLSSQSGTSPAFSVTQLATGPIYLEVLVTTICGVHYELIKFNEAVGPPDVTIVKTPTVNPREFDYGVQLNSLNCANNFLFNYVWTFLDTDFVTVLGTSNNANPTFQWPVTPGIYKVTLSVDNACGTTVVEDTYEVSGPCTSFSLPTDYTDFATGFTLSEGASPTDVIINWTGI